jgi:hypothetical protein
MVYGCIEVNILRYKFRNNRKTFATCYPFNLKHFCTTLSALSLQTTAIIFISYAIIHLIIIVTVKIVSLVKIVTFDHSLN